MKIQKGKRRKKKEKKNQELTAYRSSFFRTRSRIVKSTKKEHEKNQYLAQ